jgi:hypothetical protein
VHAQASQDDTASTTEYPALGYNDGRYENASYDNGSYDYNGTAGLLAATDDSYDSSSNAAAYYDKRTSFDTTDAAEVCMCNFQHKVLNIVVKHCFTSTHAHTSTC